MQPAPVVRPAMTPVRLPPGGHMCASAFRVWCYLEASTSGLVYPNDIFISIITTVYKVG